MKEIGVDPDGYKTFEIIINNSQRNIAYKTAQNLMIFPQNTDTDINRISLLINANLSDYFYLQPSKEDDYLPIPSPFSLETALR